MGYREPLPQNTLQNRSDSTMKTLLIILALLLCGCIGERSFYDSTNPQTPAFYDWMDKVSSVAASRDINIDGDEDWFIRYWKGGLNPETAVSRYSTETAQPERSKQ